MRDIYLGDSYDIVKRSWAESLRSIAPLYAHPRFIPLDIRAQYTAVTTIPILDLVEPAECPQLEAYLRESPDGARAATARLQLDALRSIAASAALPEWVRMRDLPLSEVPEWRVASVEALRDSTRLVIEIACRRGNGKECYFRPVDRSPPVLIDAAGRLQPMLDGGELPADVRREDREGLAAISDGRTVAITVVFAPLARGATGG